MMTADPNTSLSLTPVPAVKFRFRLPIRILCSFCVLGDGTESSRCRFGVLTDKFGCCECVNCGGGCLTYWPSTDAYDLATLFWTVGFVASFISVRTFVLAMVVAFVADVSLAICDSVDMISFSLAIDGDDQ